MAVFQKSTPDIDPDLAAFVDFIDRAKAATGWNPTKIAIEAGLSPSTVNRPYNEPTKVSHVPKRRTIRRIEQATGVAFETPAGIEIAVRAGRFEDVAESIVPLASRRSLPAPRGAPLGAFLTEVADRSCDALYHPGDLLICVRMATLNRKLRVGEVCLVACHETTVADSRVFERRIMIVNPVIPGADDLILASPTRDRRLATSIHLPRSPRATWGGAEVALPLRRPVASLDYQPRPDDPAVIEAVVTGRYRAAPPRPGAPE